MGSISEWLRQVRDGRDSAVTRLWKRCRVQIDLCASRRMAGLETTQEDRQDIVQETYTACVRALQTSGTAAHEQIRDRTDFWKYLNIAVRNKVVDLVRRMRSRREGVWGQPALEPADSRLPVSLQPVPDHREQDPAEAAASADETARLFQALRPDLISIVELKLAGYTNLEIADELDCGLSTIERRLRAIRRIWGDLLHEGTDDR